MRFVLVLGSGRSGTSLAMQALVRMGCLATDQLIESSESNPKGFYEDDRVVRLNNEIFSKIGSHAFVPVDPSVFESSIAAGIRERIKGLLVEIGSKYDGRYIAIKDPRMSTLLPFWKPVFEEIGCEVRYVIAFRSPDGVAASFSKNYTDPPELSELVWLSRNVDALYNSGFSCYLLEYEKWFTHGIEQASSLNRYLQLDKEVAFEDVDVNLNRSAHGDSEVVNPYVNELYEIMKEFSGREFVSYRAKCKVIKIKRNIENYMGWFNLLNRQFSQKNQCLRKYDQLRDDIRLAIPRGDPLRHKLYVENIEHSVSEFERIFKLFDSDC